MPESRAVHPTWLWSTLALSLALVVALAAGSVYARGGGGGAGRGGGGGGGGGFGGGGPGGGGPGGFGNRWNNGNTTNPSDPSDPSNIDPADGPPGVELPKALFSDGHHYQLQDFKGKSLIILYFDPSRSKWVDEMKDHLAWIHTLSTEPVKVLAIAKGDATTARSHMKGADPGIPIYFDNLYVYGSLYGTRHSTVACRFISSTGSASGWDATLADVTKSLADAKWKYKDDHYDKRLDAIVELLEWNQYEEAVKKLQPLRKDSIKPLAASAEKLYAAVLAEAETWRADAEKIAADKPVEAYDVYTRIAALFPTEEISVKAAEAVKQLKTQKPVVAELAARPLIVKAATALTEATKSDSPQLRDFLGQVVSKYPDTNCGQLASAIQAVLPKK